MPENFSQRDPSDWRIEINLRWDDPIDADIRRFLAYMKTRKKRALADVIRDALVRMMQEQDHSTSQQERILTELDDLRGALDLQSQYLQQLQRQIAAQQARDGNGRG